MKARFSRASESDLAAIGEFIARDSPRHALRFVRKLREKAIKAAEAPEIYPVYAQLTISVRRIVVGAYAIYFSVQHDSVVIERIIHSAMSGHPGSVDD